MQLSVIYELRANNVKEEDIETIMERVKNRLSEENIDIELQKLGYPKIFTVDYDDYNEFDYDDEDDDRY
ncbi:hypothetical protein CPU12_07480 [Malaciobacter molluscorum LMG 25693]|uniref:Uncharacterized protein n=1 Tax=Malaciobacter molluscorum LMG 25693 TaxID=870501 RepID=A0A2G1DI29_9BACT|nr:hypothetical protein [Malaciobacter molluscorum]AXX93043.1 hypothetical protein AMOL_2089 [Malaciobacter molluscorum LMG 25693]PHO18100.1 hypothetical protein CPU12_07480 [Malaciobacter molluscorum LMG 25693]RXJ94828.1 hypothetical protein CRV00_05715 [Malaciobacter molluscorum]